jgi:hypothetical protein
MSRLRVISAHLAGSHHHHTSQPDVAEHAGVELLRGLTPLQCAHYKQFGFVVLRQLYEPWEVGVLRDEFEELLERAPSPRGSQTDRHGQPIPSAGQPEPARHFKFTDPERGDDPRTFNSSKETLNRVDGALGFMPAIRRAYGAPRLLASAATLLGDDFVPFGDSYVTKPPRDGAGFTFHQDTGISVEFPYDWQEERGVNFGIYLHDSTIDNGCLHVLPARWACAPSLLYSSDTASSVPQL